MDVCTLCDTIELQDSIKSQVFSFGKNFDFRLADELQKGYFTYHKMNEALAQTRAVLGEDADGIKILSCMLRAAVDAYEVYRKKGIPDEIYFATMRCFPRFIEESYRITGKLCFDRYWWTTRQTGCHLFRIGALEYEIKHLEKEVVIGMHIPSDVVFSPLVVEKSLQEAHRFFAKHYPLLRGVEYRCHSWLLDAQLQEMLDSQSNIRHFQNRFEIVDQGEVGTEFMEWLFHSTSTDHISLPENTSLQRNVKKHLLAGGVIRNAYGRLIKAN